ncbi:hypothetical protein [Ferviditalea candida]|uniref:Transposase n=1 Tax=Ferviditalea candida TaxID=3108399 RepID=A0ABU5ZM82_9BACL|nr:hypothetical protein [Paenibacillaceae bacterium T2]
MSIKSLCLSDLDKAIALNRKLKNLIANNKPAAAIDTMEYNQSSLHTRIARLRKSSSIKITPPSPAAKKQCLQLVNMATNNFRLAKKYIRQNRLEDAENIIAATITGRILRCVNSLTK